MPAIDNFRVLTRTFPAAAAGKSLIFALALTAFTADVAGVAATFEPEAPSASGALLAELGRKMFFDVSLSASGKISCATCHSPIYAYGPPPGKAIAAGGADLSRSGDRAVPSLRYLHGNPTFSEQHHFNDGDIGPAGGFTWDGRAATLRDQARLPLLAPNEMANASPEDVAVKLGRAAYAADFRAVFGPDVFHDPRRTLEAGLRALEAFEDLPAEFYPYTSRYDAFLRGELDLSEREERGVALFKDPAKGNCASCHLVASIGGRPPTFTDYDFINVGVPRNSRLALNADPGYFDLGLCGPLRRDFLAKAEYCGYFRAPTLRNTARRDAFFHNGVFDSLDKVLHFYVDRDLQPEKYYSRNADGSVHKFDDLPPGLPDNVDRDPPLDRKPGASPAMSDEEIADLLAFLQTLTDGDVAK